MHLWPQCVPKDMLTCFLVGQVLWELARLSWHLHTSLFMERKLRLCEPVIDKFCMLAFYHFLHRSFVNDTGCSKSGPALNRGCTASSM